MAGKNPFRTTLIAPCGMDCAICMAYLREKNHCGGCYAPDRLCNINCTISSCGNVKDRYRHDCGGFPCRRLKQLDKRYRTKYHMSMIENLDSIKANGMEDFLEKQEAKWRCPTCEGTVCCHNGLCLDCNLDTFRAKNTYRWGEEK